MNKYKINMAGRIVALRSGPWGNVGTVGGFVDSESNLSHEGDCWIYDHAKVSGNAQVYGDAKIYGHSHIFGDAWVYDDATVYGNAKVFNNAWVYGHAKVFGNARVFKNAWVSSGMQVENISTNTFIDVINEMALT